ncbi:beta-galactosidase small subunit [Weissella confusa]
MSDMKTNKLKLVFGDGVLGVHTADTHYLFSYEKGGLESLRVKDVEWLYRVPKPAFWRTTTDNDRGNGFSTKSAQWFGADQFSAVVNFNVVVDGTEIAKPVSPENNRYDNQQAADQVKLTFVYQTATSPQATVLVSYEVTASGELTITATYLGQLGLPELPAFGLRLVMPEPVAGFTYQGLSGETYPDRWQGGEPGIHQIEGLPGTPYLVPQEMGMHIKTDWVTLTHLTGSHLRVDKTTDQFAFSALPFTAVELESATHQNELPPARRTILTVYGAVRGVGGIDSWGSDVQPAYRLPSDQNYTVSVTISAK